MKTLILLLFIFLAAGCRNASESAEEQRRADSLALADSLAEVRNQDTGDMMGSPDVNAFAEFGITNGSVTYRLRDWKSNLNLGALGNPTDTLSRKLTLTTDEYEGATVTQYQYDDVNLEFFQPQGNSDSWLMTIEVKNGPWTTARGIKVGDSLDELKNMYPKVEALADDKDQYSFAYSIDPSMLMFRVLTDQVNRIKIQYDLQ